MKSYVKSAEIDDKNTLELLDILKNETIKLHNEVQDTFDSIENALYDTEDNIRDAYNSDMWFNWYGESVEDNLDWVESELDKLKSMTVTIHKKLNKEVADFE